MTDGTSPAPMDGPRRWPRPAPPMQIECLVARIWPSARTNTSVAVVQAILSCAGGSSSWSMGKAAMGPNRCRHAGLDRHYLLLCIRLRPAMATWRHGARQRFACRPIMARTMKSPTCCLCSKRQLACVAASDGQPPVHLGPARRLGAGHQRRARSLPAQPGPTASTTTCNWPLAMPCHGLARCPGLSGRGLCPLPPRRLAGPTVADPCARCHAQRHRAARGAGARRFFTLMREMSAKTWGRPSSSMPTNQVLGILPTATCAAAWEQGRFAPGHRPGFNAPAPAHHCPACALPTSRPNDGAARHYQRGRGRWLPTPFVGLVHIRDLDAGQSYLTPALCLKLHSPLPALSPELLLQAPAGARGVFDVDGVLTDGGLYFSGRANPSSAFTPWITMASNCCSKRHYPGGRHGADSAHCACACSNWACATPFWHRG